MAQALVCDLCGQVFSKTTRDAASGKWNHVTLERQDGRRVKLVYGVFELASATSSLYARLKREGTEEPQGKALDVCSTCTKEMVLNGQEESNDDGVQGDREPEGEPDSG